MDSLRIPTAGHSPTIARFRSSTTTIFAAVLLTVPAWGCAGPAGESADAPADGATDSGANAAPTTGLPASTGPHAEAAIDVAVATLAALSDADTAALRRLMLPEARLVALADDPATPPRVTDLEQFLVSVSGPDADFLERMWDPSVSVDGRLATLWTPYDFYVGGEFSHCGTDIFDLVHDGSDWRVLSITYTIHRVDCPDSPLGPPA